MPLPSKTFDQFVSGMVASWSAYLGFQPSLQAGDSLFALMQSLAAQFVFIQLQIQIVNKVARAQTSTGADLDSFMAQFQFTRLPPINAEGPVTFTKFTPASVPTPIPVGSGSTIQTPGGAIVYQIVADTNQPTYDPGSNAYILAAGQTTLTATAQAVITGSGSNVAANQLSQIASGIAGIDAVTNPAAIGNGANAEPDANFRSRFVLYLNSLSKAIKAAIQSAIQGVQQGINYNLIENINTGGFLQYGEFVAVIDDGSGSPSSALVLAVQNAINAVRGFTILAEAIPVQSVTLPVVISVRLFPGFFIGIVGPQVASAISAMMAQVGIGGTAFVSAVEAAALSVPGVVSVQSGTLLNGVAADFQANGFQEPRTPTNSVAVGTY